MLIFTSSVKFNPVICNYATLCKDNQTKGDKMLIMRKGGTWMNACSLVSHKQTDLSPAHYQQQNSIAFRIQKSSKSHFLAFSSCTQTNKWMRRREQLQIKSTFFHHSTRTMDTHSLMHFCYCVACLSRAPCFVFSSFARRESIV